MGLQSMAALATTSDAASAVKSNSLMVQGQSEQVIFDDHLVVQFLANLFYFSEN